MISKNSMDKNSMKIARSISSIFLAGLVLLAAAVSQTDAWAAQIEDAGSATPPGSLSADMLPRVQLNKVDLGETRVEDESRRLDGDPYRFAMPELVSLNPDNSGLWEMLPNTDQLWRLRVEVLFGLDQQGGIPTLVCLHQQPRRLVNHQQMIVLVNDSHGHQIRG